MSWNVNHSDIFPPFCPPSIIIGMVNSLSNRWTLFFLSCYAAVILSVYSLCCGCTSMMWVLTSIWWSVSCEHLVFTRPFYFCVWLSCSNKQQILDVKPANTLNVAWRNRVLSHQWGPCTQASSKAEAPEVGATRCLLKIIMIKNINTNRFYPLL